MKKLFTMLILIAVLLLGGTSVCISQTATSPSTGDGSSVSPYQIATLNNLYWIAASSSRWSYHYVQTADIDASGTSSWNSGAGWLTIGDDVNDFTGTYDGKGHTITGLYVNRSARDYVGLFGSIKGATIKNLGLVNASIIGAQYVGGLVGYAYSNASTISNCFSTGSISGTASVGGLIGYTDNNDFLVSNCYSHCSVSGTSSVGGFIGTINNQSSISNCYSKGAVSGSTDIGGFVGTNSSSGYGVVTNCFWDTQTSGQSFSPGGIGKTTALMQTASTFTSASWSSSDWSLADGSYPKLLWESPGTFTGALSNDWATAGNWAGGSVPGSSTDVIIPSGKTAVISATTEALCNGLTASGTLTIQSSSSNTGSLIVSGTATGNVNAERYLTGNAWHVVSPIAYGGSISTFIQAPGNAIPVNGSSQYGMMDYNESTNLWEDYFTASTSGTLISGQGYSLRRSGDGVVTFTGTLYTDTKTVALTKLGEGWNCIGNPYTSAIGMNSSAGTASNFLGVNASSSLDQNYACVYVWDPTSSSYKIIGGLPSGLGSERSLEQSLLQSGQGFFVKAKEAGSLISFTLAMQTHSTETALKSAEASWPGFELTASASGVKASTIVAFNNQMTKGLDPTYDAGLLRGANGLSLYTKLIDDNGVDFAIQCLPENGMESFVVPVGLDAKVGGEVKFSATTIGLPTGSSLILEDRTAKVYTDLSNGGEYAVTLSANSSGTGRFYIHTSNLTTGTSGLLPTEGFSLKAYPANGLIWIEGSVSSSAKAYLFNTSGSNLGVFNLQEGNRNSIPASGLATGVYLLKVTDGSKQFNTKIVLN